MMRQIIYSRYDFLLYDLATVTELTKLLHYMPKHSLTAC